MSYVANGKANRKSKTNIDPLFFERWQYMSPHERGTEEAKEAFRAHKKEWTERTIPGLRGLTPTQRLHLRSIGDLVSFSDAHVAEAGTARVMLQTLAEICATSIGAIERSIMAGEAHGVLGVRRSHRECNVYTLLFPEALVTQPESLCDSESGSCDSESQPLRLTLSHLHRSVQGNNIQGSYSSTLSVGGKPPPSESPHTPSQRESEEAREASKVPPPPASGVERTVRPLPWSPSPSFLPSGNLNGYSARPLLSGAELFGIPGLSRPRLTAESSVCG